MMLVSNKYDAYATDFFELLFMSVSVFLLKTTTLAAPFIVPPVHCAGCPTVVQ